MKIAIASTLSLAALALAGCGEATTMTANASAATPTTEAQSAGLEAQAGLRGMMDEGGPVGCPNGPVRDRAGRVLERIGGGSGCAEPATETATASDGDWAGKYKGDFDGGDGEVSIGSADASGRRKVDVSVAGSGCSGQIVGNAALSGDKLILKQRDGNGEMCTVTMTRDGKGIAIAEDGCLSYHGMTCAFVGTASKIGGRSTAAAGGMAIGDGKAWLVDTAWVDDMRGCPGGSYIRYERNGRYEQDGVLRGRWSIKGNQLYHLALEESPELGEPFRPIPNPKAIAWTIVQPGREKVTMRFPDGRTMPMFRCAPN